MGEVYYDRTGDPIGLDQWHEHYLDPDYRRVALTAVLDPSDLGAVSYVCTMWLGIDQNFLLGRVNNGATAPLIYETLVNTGDHGGADDVVERYSSEADALAGHKRHVAERSADIPDVITVDL
jgi:hypothetical protein